jgi:AcrR family transcriptional regulator
VTGRRPLPQHSFPRQCSFRTDPSLQATLLLAEKYLGAAVRRDPLARQVQKEQTRALLVDAALRVFTEHGYEEATVEEIAAAAGYSKGAYYFHFASKEDIFLELLEQWTGEQTERLRAFNEATPAAAALLESLEAFLSYGEREIAWPRLLVEFWAQARHHENIRHGLGQAYAAWRRLLAQAFRRAAYSGLFTAQLDPDDAARLVLATHDGLVVEACIDPEASRKVSLRRVLGALLAYLASPAAKELSETARAPAPKRPAGKARRPQPPAA